MDSQGTILFILLILTFLLLWRIVVLRRRIKAERMLTYFATSLYGRNAVEDIFWDIAKNCISQLKFEDCVIYQYDKKRNMLVQRAAYGPKNPQKYEILNPLEIVYGVGIVGSVARNMKPEIVKDTKADSRYIVDDFARNSEIAVPIIIDGELFGVIDSEHHRKGFYSQWHLKMLVKMSQICAVKISKFIAEERLRLKIARDLHDEMGSTLTSINIISKIAMEQARENEHLHGQISKIKDHSSVMMETMSD
ncbi:MAG: GAF domain-containing protein, partial [Chitinophagaceae bacterium]|nr:GAF domain-containing protein [Chitinophagaceae bacterium]